jgi:hypothetical protein
MSGRLSRDGILEALQDLPPDATVDDAIESIPHAEVKRRLGM